jgi:hypothetical protein
MFKSYCPSLFESKALAEEKAVQLQSSGKISKLESTIVESDGKQYYAVIGISLDDTVKLKYEFNEAREIKDTAYFCGVKITKEGMFMCSLEDEKIGILGACKKKPKKPKREESLTLAEVFN